MEEAGYVYILTNDSFREDWIKIGKSSRPVNVRSKELDNTSIPLPFNIYATLKTVKYGEVEKHLHKMLKRDLIRSNREFFNIKPEVALDYFETLVDIIDDAEIRDKDGKIIYSNKNMNNGTPPQEGKISVKPKEEKKNHLQSDNTLFQKIELYTETRKEIKYNKRKENFKFSMVDIQIGEYLTFIPTGVKVKVISSDNKIEYNGKQYNLTEFTKEFMPNDRRNPHGQYQGPRFFSYNGRLLTDLRDEKERSQD